VRGAWRTLPAKAIVAWHRVGTDMRGGIVVLALVAGLTDSVSAQPRPNLIGNPSFEEGTAAGPPQRWALYGTLTQTRRLSLVDEARDGRRALLIDDADSTGEIGVSQTVAARGELGYRASVWVRGLEASSPIGAYLQMRFIPSQQLHQRSLAAEPGEWKQVTVSAVAPAGTTHIAVYLYTHSAPTPKVIVDDVSLVGGVDVEEDTVPPPVPPDIAALKDLDLATDLVRDGKPMAAIVRPASGVHDQAARQISQAIEQLTGCALPVITDSDPRAAVPLVGNVILLGNRSTNRAIGTLYDRHYTFLDAKHPGQGGYEVRTLHSPFGDGRNAILVGGSDRDGVAEAAGRLVDWLKASGPRRGALTVGWRMDVRLSSAYQVPDDIQQVETWSASEGYGSGGYFGWNPISKHMALYYMTGDETHAQEFLRLAFPDARAKQELADIAGEMIENKDAPLSGPYHYNAHEMILLWDLIEESPAFTDEQRLAVTRAFSQQLLHRKDEGIYVLQEPPPYIGSRHGQWSAVSLYCLGRYFDTYYPHRVWRQCVQGAQHEFRALDRSSWVTGEMDALYWYPTGIAPILVYATLTGDRVGMANGALAELLQNHEALISGEARSWGLRYASLDHLNRAAYLTGDGRWVAYRQRVALSTDVFRVGQSFWPDGAITPEPPDDLTGKWTISRLPLPAWYARSSGLPREQSFHYASYRSTSDASGDFVLLDGYNAAYRNPYHSLALLELRIGGCTVLRGTSPTDQGYLNQVLTKSEGMVEPVAPMDAALERAGAVGDVACAIGRVANASFCDWRRAILHTVGRYAVVADEVIFRDGSPHMELTTLWQTAPPVWDPQGCALSVETGSDVAAPPGWRRFRAVESYRHEPAGPEASTYLESYDVVLLRGTEPGAWVEMTISLERPTDAELYAQLLGYRDRGVVQCILDGEEVGPPTDLFADTPRWVRLPLGRHSLATGSHTLRVEVVGRHGSQAQCYVGLGGLLVKPAGVAGDAAPSTFRVIPCDPLTGTVDLETSSTRMAWRGPVQAGERRVQFNLIAPGSLGPQCARIAESAASLALPEPALAVAGTYEGCEADLLVLSPSRLSGTGVRRVALGQSLVSSGEPIDIDWDLQGGALSIVCEQPARVLLHAPLAGLAGPPSVRIGPGPGGTREVSLPSGSYVLDGAVLSETVTGALADELASLLARATEARQIALGRGLGPPAKTTDLPELTSAWSVQLGEPIVAVEQGTDGPEPVVFAATSAAIHVFGADGSPRGRFTTDGPIRVLRWWPEERLLLAGCKDEKVIAFDVEGRRRWAFTSQMDPAVFRAGKQYWFKSAPGHEGIHGLHTGTFLDGGTQAFVGSACTLEILDGQGKLLRRLPVFWGPGTVFGLLDAPDGTRNLLLGRSPNDSHYLAVINSKTLDTTPRSFGGVPPGHTDIGGFAVMDRRRLLCEDLDGDGVKEVASEVNGVWNRLTIWSADGTPRHSAHFGPGPKAPARTVADVAVTGREGDRERALIVALSDGLVVAFDAQCRRLWSADLAAAPVALGVTRTAGGALATIACADGSVWVLSAQGKPSHRGRAAGTPVGLLVAQWARSQRILVATTDGELRAFEAP